MSVYKRGGVYWYDFWFKGQRFRESARTSNKTSALRIEALRRADLTQGRVRRDSPSFAAFVKDEFLPWSKLQHQAHPNTHKRYRVSARVLVRFFGNLNLDAIATPQIENFKLKRLRECSAAGTNRDLAALRSMLNFAARHGYIAESPFRGVQLLPEGPGMMRIVSPEEEALYFSQASPLLRDIATLILQTGMRPGEVYRIKGGDVKDGYIVIPEGKTRFARRTIPLTPGAQTVLKLRMRNGYLFPHRKDPLRPMVMTRSHEHLVRRLKLDFRLYDLRHTFGSRMAMAGVDLATLKELMGHSSITITMRYIHPTPAHKVEAMEKLVRFNGGSPQMSPQSSEGYG